MTAIWTAPRTWNTGEIVTASVMNQHVRDNLEFLKLKADTPLNNVSSFSGSGYVTTSTTFVDINATFNDSLTTTGAPVLIGMYGTWKSNTAAADCCLDIMIDGVRIGDATYGVQLMQQAVANMAVPLAWSQIRPLAAGAHTIKPVWRTSTGTLNLILVTSFFVMELI